jgi:hypothetical protein
MIAVIILLLLVLLGACLHIRATLAEHGRQLKYQGEVIDRITRMQTVAVSTTCRSSFGLQMRRIGMSDAAVDDLWDDLQANPLMIGYWNLYWQRVADYPPQHAKIDCIMTWWDRRRHSAWSG